MMLVYLTGAGMFILLLTFAFSVLWMLASAGKDM